MLAVGVALAGLTSNISSTRPSLPKLLRHTTITSGPYPYLSTRCVNLLEIIPLLLLYGSGRDFKEYQTWQGFVSEVGDLRGGLGGRHA